jgi:hypothetical protein
LRDGHAGGATAAPRAAGSADEGVLGDFEAAIPNSRLASAKVLSTDDGDKCWV